jgi:hypothetical protein
MAQSDLTFWHVAAQVYLKRLGEAEYTAQRKSHKGAAKKFRFFPSDYMRDLIAAMGRNDEEGFKAQKMLEGYASRVGV